MGMRAYSIDTNARESALVYLVGLVRQALTPTLSQREREKEESVPSEISRY
jgi:hypothetical protein